ncbi:MAG: hypothetical protein KDK54_01940 [Leptospiraceae bacterium]|nr:hypothetical protein [Leptospiraceae bacterium]
MENKDTKSMEKLKIQADQVNLAMDSVPTEQIAKEVLKGKIKDALYIKLKISIENRLGIASILVSTYKKKILEVYSIAGNGNILTKTIPFEEPKSFIQKFIDFNDEGEVDTSLTETIGRSIYYAFPPKVLASLINQWGKKELTSTINMLQVELSNQSGTGKIKIDADIENVSSIFIRYDSPLTGRILPIQEPVQNIDEEENEPKGQLLKEFMEKEAPKYGSQMTVNTMLSPTDGIEIFKLKAGDLVLFKVPFDTIKEKKEADELGLVDENGKLIQIEGEFLSLISENQQYHLFAKGFGGRLLHSIETQPVRVLTKSATKKVPKPIPNKPKEEVPTNSPLPKIIIGVVIIILLGIIIISFTS